MFSNVATALQMCFVLKVSARTTKNLNLLSGEKKKINKIQRKEEKRKRKISCKVSWKIQGKIQHKIKLMFINKRFMVFDELGKRWKKFCLFFCFNLTPQNKKLVCTCVLLLWREP